jgi:hypothetical protein
MTPLECTQFLEESCFAVLFEPNSQSMQKPIEGLSHGASLGTVLLTLQVFWDFLKIFNSTSTL